jgi:predicted DNA-binding antitoxin AbrB/MazE fold protein
MNLIEAIYEHGVFKPIGNPMLAEGQRVRIVSTPFSTQLPNITEDEERIEKTIRLLDEWMADESGYDEETWPEIKAALNRERDNVSARRLFDE